MSSSRRSSGLLITTGAVGVAVTTASEVFTAPYSPAVSAYPLNGAAHAVKVLAALLFIAGLLAWLGDLRRQGHQVAAIAAGALATATLIGAVPYSVVETLLSPSLSPTAADAQLEATYDAHPWIAILASVALPLVLLGVVLLAVAVLRRRMLPAWAPIASLAAIPVAFLAGVLGDAGWVLPHPPAWLFLGIAAYGPALARTATETEHPLVSA